MDVLEAAHSPQTTVRGPARLVRALRAPAWAELILCFWLGMLLSAAPVAEGPAPFGVAMLSAMEFGSGSALCLLGCLLGYFAGFGLQAGAQMAGGCCLVFTANYFLRGHRLRREKWLPVLMASAAFGVTRGALYLLTGGFSVLILVRMCFYLLLCAVSAYLFADVMDLREPRTLSAELCRSVSIVCLLACLLLGLSRLILFHTVSAGRILSIVILLVLSATGGPLCGASAGVVVGTAMDIASAGGAYFAAVYSVAGLSAGLLSKYRRGGLIIVFLLTYSLTVFCLPNHALRMAALIEASVSGVVFLCLPQKLVLSVGSFVQPQRAGRGESGLRRYVAGRVGSMSQAYRALYDVASEYSQSGENDADPSRVFDRAAERVCASCPRRSLCWAADAGDTRSALNDVSLAAQERGLAEETDYPEWFRSRCDRLATFTQAVNGELRLRAYRRQMRQQVGRERAVLWDQYRDFSEVLGASARALGSVHGADPTAERRLVRYLRTLGVEADASVFRDDRGRLHAAIESRFLEPLLKSPDYLDGLSAVLGVRLCMPEHQAREDSIVLLEAEPFSASVGIAAVRKQGESVSGDRGTYFKTDSGQLCVILSDGMGTGLEASAGSIGTVRILENFLRAGVDPSNAMKLLNAAALVRDADNWGYATVDLMCIDLFTGEASFYKYGAAPSYVRSGGVIRKIRCSSFAPGLDSEAGKSPDVMRVRLKPGSVAVIASDGIVSDGQDLWLRTLLTESDGEDMKALAGEVVKTAVQEYGRNDDMTALAIKMEVRT